MFGIIALGAAAVTEGAFSVGVYIGRKTKAVTKEVEKVAEFPAREITPHVEPKASQSLPLGKPLTINEDVHDFGSAAYADVPSPAMPVDFGKVLPAPVVPEVPAVIKQILNPAQLAEQRIRNAVHDL